MITTSYSFIRFPILQKEICLTLVFGELFSPKVEKLCWRKRQDPDVLAKTVEAAWAEFSVETIGKVYKRWTRVLDLIQLDNGGNRFVESLRGQLTKDPNATEADEDTAFLAEIEKMRQVTSTKHAQHTQQGAENQGDIQN